MNPNQLGPQHFLVPGQQREQVYHRYNQPLQSQHNPETSEESSSEEEYERPNIPLDRLQQPNKQLNRKRYLRDNLLIAYSGDRNIEGGETTFNYTINFNESQSGNVKTSAFFNTSLKNIRSISILDVVMPNFYLDIPLIHGLANQFYYTPLADSTMITTNTKPAEHDDNIRIMRPPRLQDLPFILLKIQGLDGDMKGTNPDIDTATCMLTIDHIRQTTNNSSGCYETLNKVTPDTMNQSDGNPELKKIQKGNVGDHILADTDKNILYFKNKTGIQKQFFPNPLARLGSLKIDFFDHLGNPLKFQSNYLELSSVNIINPNSALGVSNPSDSKNAYLEIRTKTLYSPEEFRIGDNIVFRNIVCNPRNVTIESFLNRREGHVLLKHQLRSIYKATTTSFDNYYYRFLIFSQIQPELNVTLLTAADAQPMNTTEGTRIVEFSSTEVKTDLSTDANAINITDGFAINQSMQHTISFNIKTEEYVYNTEDTELI